MPNVQAFNIEGMRPYTISLAIGMRGSGKSVVMANVLRAVAGRDRTDGYKRISKVYVISDTEPVTGYYSQWVEGPDFFAEVVTPELLQGIIDVQRQAIPTGLDPERREAAKANDSVCLVLDDITFNASIFKSKPMRWLFMNGRHYGFNIILGMQFCMDMPPAMRSQIDYVFALHEPSFANRKRLFEHYFGVFENIKEFKTVFSACTVNYKCLVLDKHIRESDPYKVTFWFLATQPEKLVFSAGSESFRRFNRMRAKILQREKRSGVQFTQVLS